MPDRARHYLLRAWGPAVAAVAHLVLGRTLVAGQEDVRGITQAALTRTYDAVFISRKVAGEVPHFQIRIYLDAAHGFRLWVRRIDRRLGREAR